METSLDELVSSKSRLTAALLCWFLGYLGIHHFYVGRVGSGICQILFGWLTLFIWNFVDFVMILCGTFKDEYGYPVKDWSPIDA